MAVNYSAGLKTTRMQAVRDAIDAATGAGTLEICSAAYASVLIIYTLDATASSVTGAVLTLAGLPKTANAAAGGTAAVARIKDGDANVVCDGLSVGVSASDIIISNTTINNAAPYSLTAGTITHAA